MHADARPVFLRIAFAQGGVVYLDCERYCALDVRLLEGARIELVRAGSQTEEEAAPPTEPTR